MMVRLLTVLVISCAFPRVVTAQASRKVPAKHRAPGPKLVRPSFPGGTDSLMRYIRQHLRYPEADHEAGIEGRVFVRFMVDTKGDVGQISVLRSSGAAGLDAEAVRVIRDLPRWHPGKYGNKAAAMFYVLPVTFWLE